MDKRKVDITSPRHGDTTPVAIPEALASLSAEEARAALAKALADLGKSRQAEAELMSRVKVLQTGADRAAKLERKVEDLKAANKDGKAALREKDKELRKLKKELEAAAAKLEEQAGMLMAFANGQFHVDEKTGRLHPMGRSSERSGRGWTKEHPLEKDADGNLKPVQPLNDTETIGDAADLGDKAGELRRKAGEAGGAGAADGEKPKRPKRDMAAEAARLMKANPDMPREIEGIGFDEPPTCSRCGARMTLGGYFIQYKLRCRQVATIVEVRHPQFVCPECEPEPGEPRKVTIHDDDNVFATSVCAPDLVAWIVFQHFALGTTYNKIAEDIASLGVDIPVQTMVAWVMLLGRKVARGLKKALEEKVMACPMVNADETNILVLQLEDPDKPGQRKAPNSRYNAYMVIRIGRDERGREVAAAFDFISNRNDDTLKKLFQGYSGIVQTDGLKNYGRIFADMPAVRHILCLAHMRREVVGLYGAPDSPSYRAMRPDDPKRMLVDAYSAPFFHVDELRELLDKGGIGEEEYIWRRRSVLIEDFERIKALSETVVAMEKSQEARTGVSYFLGGYDKIRDIAEIPWASLDNNCSERGQKDLIKMRKTSFFTISKSSTEATAVFFSLAETCDRIGVDFKAYLTKLARSCARIGDDDTEAWKAMLPGVLDCSEFEPPRAGDGEGLVLRGKAYRS